MQHLAQAAPFPGSQSFAGLLAALALPTRESPDSSQLWESSPLWSDSSLAEDMAALSYERALRDHARYKPADPRDGPVVRAAGPGPDDAQGAAIAQAAEAGEGLPVQGSAAPRAAADRDLRSSSVTIRLSNAECARLRQRASEAGLTVSAYLRSCTLEAEALRAEVKKALAELRSAGEAGNKGTRERGNKGTQPIRVLARIGSLCVGLSTNRSS